MNEIQLLSLGYVLFMVLIAGEAMLSWRRRDGRYRAGELVVNIGHGAIFQVADGLTKAFVLLPFLWIREHAPATLPIDAAWGWLVGLLLFDFAFYWLHRHHHRIHALWAIHGVHHAAEDYNFAAALRQALFGNLTSWIWKAPLALVMPLEMFIGITVVDYIYQFVLHTRYVPKLGPIGWVFNTPSHHRVHHGRQPQYLDKNYGGMLIIWDRLFGTFEPEREEADVGITAPPNSLNPVWGNLILWRDLARASRGTRGLVDQLKLWLGPPDLAEQVAGPQPKRAPAPLENAAVEPGRLRYAVIAFVGGLVMVGALPWLPAGSTALQLVVGGLVIASALTPAALLESRSWAAAAEAVRLVVTAGLLVVSLVTAQPLFIAGVAGVTLLAAAVGGGAWIAARRPLSAEVG